MEDRDEKREVVWMPAFASAVITLIVTTLFLPLGAVMTIAGLVVLAVRLPRREWTVLTWLGLGTVIGSAAFWILVVLDHALR